MRCPNACARCGEKTCNDIAQCKNSRKSTQKRYIDEIVGNVTGTGSSASKNKKRKDARKEKKRKEAAEVISQLVEQRRLKRAAKELEEAEAVAMAEEEQRKLQEQQQQLLASAGQTPQMSQNLLGPGGVPKPPTPSAEPQAADHTATAEGLSTRTRNRRKIDYSKQL